MKRPLRSWIWVGIMEGRVQSSSIAGRTLRILIIIAVFTLIAAPCVHAGIIRGVQSILAGVLEVPRATLVGTLYGPPIVGTVIGALSGTVRGLGFVAGGALEILSGTIPLVKKAAPFIPIFL